MSNKIEYIPESEPARSYDGTLDRIAGALVMLMMIAISAATLLFLVILAAAILWNVARWGFL